MRLDNDVEIRAVESGCGHVSRIATTRSQGSDEFGVFEVELLQYADGAGETFGTDGPGIFGPGVVRRDGYVV